MSVLIIFWGIYKCTWLLGCKSFITDQLSVVLMFFFAEWLKFECGYLEICYIDIGWSIVMAMSTNNPEIIKKSSNECIDIKPNLEL